MPPGPNQLSVRSGEETVMRDVYGFVRADAVDQYAVGGAGERVLVHRDAVSPVAHSVQRGVEF
jgi:hypothetical protein